ncbi:hypothetical protein [Halobaculum gomorrense]|uniref:DUF8151 domain-containing protein n=1 Tax=Halobaculum gomorrense TaxID=43928 RepID=A0A1M5JM85_9EURY|nr:hypothetical protein [Halobaculum gomorrense]SHG41686.1 hypothetical protein SAMN05443636_0178 [Halobaculum gomorrense]
MQTSLFDTAWAVAEYVFVAAASVALTGIGVVFEQDALAAYAAAQPDFAVVDFALGTLALVWGVYLVGYRQLVPRTRRYLRE